MGDKNSIKKRRQNHNSTEVTCDKTMLTIRLKARPAVMLSDSWLCEYLLRIKFRNSKASSLQQQFLELW